MSILEMPGRNEYLDMYNALNFKLALEKGAIHGTLPYHTCYMRQVQNTVIGFSETALPGWNSYRARQMYPARG